MKNPHEAGLFLRVLFRENRLYVNEKGFGTD
jgi:hypothetical protein